MIYIWLLLLQFIVTFGSEIQHYKRHDDSLLPLNLRSINDYSLSDYLLISDIDGNLHNIDRNTGNLIWSLDSDPLVKIINNSSENSQPESHNHNDDPNHNNTHNHNIIWFVEPYEDGSLYYFTNEFGLNKLPTSIKDLVLQSPFSLNDDDNIYTGSMKTQLYTIDVHSGEVLKQFGDTCINYQNDNFPNNNKNNHIMIGKTTYELTIHSKLNANMIWYVTYSQWGPNNIDNDLISQNKRSIDELYFTPFHDKSLLGINQNLGMPVWITKLPSLAINVFDIFENLKTSTHHLIPHPLKVLNDLQINHDENNDLCFINITNNQWFAMSFLNYPTLIKSAPISKYQSALSKLDHHNDTNVLNELRSLELSDIDYINGIHKVNILGPETNYQPVSKFSKPQYREDNKQRYESNKLIEQNQNNYDLIIPEHTVPSIIQGIKLTKTTNQLLPTSPQERDFIHETFLPGEYYPTHKEVDSIPLVKRICEDVAVLLILLGLFVSISKFGGFIKGFKISNHNPLEVKINDLNVEKDLPEADDKGLINIKDFSNEAMQVPQLNDSETKVHSDDKEQSLEPEVKEEDDTNKRRRRGGRGGKRTKRKQVTISQPSDDEHDDDEGEETIIPTTSLVKKSTAKSTIKKLQFENNLIISDKILGYGSHGTVVYQGSFENRPVAVKRMLLDFYDVANHEVSLLQQSDDHPNVVRYFCSQSSLSEKFLYIALELCQGSLEDLIDKNACNRPINFNFNPNKKFDLNDLLFQLTQGLNYLHNLKIVHRDLKPQNILIGDNPNKVRLLISDFGLCKKLDNDQSSFRPTTQNAASGTSGWRAPELLLNHDIVEISPDTISSNSNYGSNILTGINDGTKRLTKAIDTFALGCIFFYILTGGNHPFGDRYLREGNIIKGEYNLELLDNNKDSVESKHLIEQMINFNPSLRPNTEQILKHPLFWSKNKKLEFLLKVSDRFEIEKRDPPSALLVKLESVASKVSKNWHTKFDEEFLSNLGKYRKYQPHKLMDLLRALRNKYHHFNDMPPSLQQQMSPLPNGFYEYFNHKFPNLLMEVYFVVAELKSEHIFEEYY